MFTAPKGMTSFLPNYLWALIAWVEENGYEPHVSFDRHGAGVSIPASEKANLSPIMTVKIAKRNIHNLYLGAVEMTFNAKFNGVDHPMVIPYATMWVMTAPGEPNNWMVNLRAMVAVARGDMGVAYGVTTHRHNTDEFMTHIGQALMADPNLHSRMAGADAVVPTTTEAPNADTVTPSQTTVREDNVIQGRFGQRKKS